MKKTIKKLPLFDSTLQDIDTATRRSTLQDIDTAVRHSTLFSRHNIRSIQDIGKVVQQVRKENKLTQHRLAALCKVTPKFLSELETGKNKHFSLQLVLRVTHFLGINFILEKRKIK